MVVGDGGSGDGRGDTHSWGKRLSETWGRETTWSDASVSTASFFNSRDLDGNQPGREEVDDIEPDSGVYRKTSLLLMLILALCLATLVAILLSWFWLLRKHLSIRRINHGRDNQIFRTVLLTKSTSVTGLHLGEECSSSALEAKDEKCEVHESITVINQLETQASVDKRWSKSVSTSTRNGNSPCVADHQFGQTGDDSQRPETHHDEEKDERGCDGNEGFAQRAPMRPVAWYVPLNDDVTKIRHSTLLADSGLDVSSPSKEASEHCTALGVSRAEHDTKTCEQEIPACILETSEKSNENCGPWTLESPIREDSADHEHIDPPHGGEPCPGRLANDSTFWEQREERPVMFMVINAAAND